MTIAATLTISIDTRAELGGAPSWPDHSSVGISILAQQAPLAAKYTLSETKLRSGTVVREYVGQDGVVFAVVWHGPQMAPLNKLLGAYFPPYIDGLNEVHRARGGGNGAAIVRQPGLIVQTGGHMGSFAGRAYLPQALPPGTEPDDLQ
ncbi:DUF2844 domain-containing protein [Paraburkholderia susongensis]|nr:DUF2844 domain-containing protein [Paraburkholderia susongensis]